jgi:hypothetical protein
VDKYRIFIASSGRTLILAEKPRDAPGTEFCEASLWSEESRFQPGEIEILQGAARQYDFAIIILARDDVMAVMDRCRLGSAQVCGNPVLSKSRSAVGRPR